MGPVRSNNISAAVQARLDAGIEKARLLSEERKKKEEMDRLEAEREEKELLEGLKVPKMTPEEEAEFLKKRNKEIEKAKMKRIILDKKKREQEELSKRKDLSKNIAVRMDSKEIQVKREKELAECKAKARQKLKDIQEKKERKRGLVPKNTKVKGKIKLQNLSHPRKPKLRLRHRRPSANSFDANLSPVSRGSVKKGTTSVKVIIASIEDIDTTQDIVKHSKKKHSDNVHDEKKESNNFDVSTLPKKKEKKRKKKDLHKKSQRKK